MEDSYFIEKLRELSDYNYRICVSDGNTVRRYILENDMLREENDRLKEENNQLKEIVSDMLGNIL